MTNTFLPSETNIFISYRRVDGLEHARIIYLDLRNHGYSNIFFDYNALRDGAFDIQIETAIRSCTDFILILSPQSMNRCHIDDDWVAHELRLAIKYNKKIIPVCINTAGFNWPSNFPTDLRRICTIQRHCMRTDEYFADSMRMLARRRLLTRPKVDATEPVPPVRREDIDITTNNESLPIPQIRETLTEWGVCRLASFTDNGQGVIVKGNNEFFYTPNIPEGMKRVLASVQENPYAYIAEIGITEYYWFVIYKDSSWHGKGYVPDRFKHDLNHLFKTNEMIRSVSMNDNGDYIVITNTRCIATREKDQEIIKKAKCGRIRAAHITNDGALIKFERGIKGYCVPTEVIAKLEELGKVPSSNPKLLRFTDGGLYLFANEVFYSTFM